MRAFRGWLLAFGCKALQWWGQRPNSLEPLPIRKKPTANRQTPTATLAIALVLCCVATYSWAELPEGIVDTQPGEEQPPTPQESLDLITVPEGFHISLFAGEPDVAQPIAINYDDRGRLWVLESFSYIEWKRNGKDRLLIFEDTDNDGRFDKRSVFWDKGNHTSGFQIGFGGVWLCDAPSLLFIPDADRDDVPDGEPRVVLDGWSTEAEHNFFNGLTWGPDGWLYGRHGIKKPSKVGKPGTPDDERIDLSCSIWRYHPVKEDFEIWADGTINPWGLDWNEEGEGFINTSVIDHFWHLVPGARYQRTPGKGGDALNPYSYELMKPTSDHRHWSGGETGRKDFASNDEAGGGHSHCGMVIYQSDAWPEEYRGRAFFSNVLGQRINMEHVLRSGSGWVAKHGEDFLRSSSPWFRAVDLKQGPQGEMMIAEWTDLGECHDRDGIHRSSGRLYEVWYGERPAKRRFDVAQGSMEDLLDWLFHENVWWRRQALRNLHERVQLENQGLSPGELEGLLERAKEGPVRDAISAIQALHAFRLPFKQWVPSVYGAALGSNRSSDRAAILIHLLTLAFTEETPSPDMITWLESVLRDETDHAVLYRVAALQQRIPLAERWGVAEAIAGVQLWPDDLNFALMRWYGFEPLVEMDPARAMAVALKPGHPHLSQWIARRAVSADALDVAISGIQEQHIEDDTLREILDGLLVALPSRAEMPIRWERVYASLKKRSDPLIRRQAFALAQCFGDPVAEKEMVTLVLNRETPPNERRDYFQMLISARSRAIADQVPGLIADPLLSEEAIRAEAAFPGKDSADRLLVLLENEKGKEGERSVAILETLSSRADFADRLVDAVIEGEVDQEMIPAYIARQVMMVSLKKSAFARHLGIDEAGEAQKAALLKKWKARLNESYLAHADPIAGREVYRRTCAACHKLYGEGGEIGPDLTGSGRSDLDYFLINVLFPSEDVAPDYRLVSLVLKDGRTLSGNIVEENEQVITIRQVGNLERIDADQVVQRQVYDVSLMPPGLIDNLRRDDVRDLVGYLRTVEPLP